MRPGAGRYDARAVALRALVAVLPVVALLFGVPAGATPQWPVVVLVAALALGAACFPDNAVVSVVLVVVVAWWAVALLRVETSWTLPVAAALVGAHVAASVASSAPVRTRPHSGLVLRWLGRWVLLVASAGAALVLVLALREAPLPGVVWPLGVLVAGVTAALARVAVVGASRGR